MTGGKGGKREKTTLLAEGGWQSGHAARGPILGRHQARKEKGGEDAPNLLLEQ